MSKTSKIEKEIKFLQQDLCYVQEGGLNLRNEIKIFFRCNFCKMINTTKTSLEILKLRIDVIFNWWWWWWWWGKELLELLFATKNIIEDALKTVTTFLILRSFRYPDDCLWWTIWWLSRYFWQDVPSNQEKRDNSKWSVLQRLFAIFIWWLNFQNLSTN